MVISYFSTICSFSIDFHYIHRSKRYKKLFPKLLVRQCLRRVNFDCFPLLYSDGLYCFFCHVCPHPSSCKSDPTWWSNSTLPKLHFRSFSIWRNRFLSAFLFLLNLPFSLISLVSHVPSPDLLLPWNKSLLNPFFFPDAVVSLRNSLHFIPLPMLSSWVPATTWRLG